MFLDILTNNLHNSIFKYKGVLDYLYSREVTDEDIKYYNLGFSKFVHVPKENSYDYEKFMDDSKRGHKIEEKIIFPIKSIDGRVVGLLGRSVEKKEFKILVTQEAKFTGFFLGLSQALPYIYKENRAYVVEGDFDLIAFKKVCPNTVGSLTAGINESQYSLLRLFCDQVVTVFDNDDTGKRGTEKAQKLEGVFSLEIGYKDPAKCLETLKLEKFKNYITKKIQNIPNFMKG